MNEILSKEAHPLVIYAKVNELLLDSDWFHYSPDTLMVLIDKKIAPLQISKHNLNKLLAVQSILTSDAAWQHYEVFLAIMQALNTGTISPDILHITENPLPYLFQTVELMNILRKQEFSKEVKLFCAGIFLHENVHYCPEPLDFCQTDVSQPKYECNKCGNTGSALPPFIGTCLECAKVHDLEETQKPFNFKPPEDAEIHGDIKITLTYTFEEEKSAIKSVWKN